MWAWTPVEGVLGVLAVENAKSRLYSFTRQVTLVPRRSYTAGQITLVHTATYVVLK